MEESNIALFKLISGEELVTEYKADGEFYVFKAPRKIVLMQVSATEVKPRLLAWVIGHQDGVFPVHSGHVITVSADIDEGLKNAYIAQFSSLDLSAKKPTKLLGV